MEENRFQNPDPDVILDDDAFPLDPEDDDEEEEEDEDATDEVDE